MITAADSARLRATIHATPTAPLPHRVRTDAEITADFRRVRGEHFARLAEELPSSEAWDTLAREVADEQHTLGELLAATDALAARGGGR